ncbi:hypothetical protein [Streptomyces sp. NBC_00690]|uniref:hypothetical protein n=1 Tax=Streptomyces sp. NBC_00690 TaxID=2975808 RepID=UPI002E28869C|nr:hypothetical protein [Streptomyces sp. NBC_00690]
MTGFAAAPAPETVMDAVPNGRAGTGAAVNDLIRETGGALGIATLLTTHGTMTHPGTSGVPPGKSRAAWITGIRSAAWAAAGAALLAALVVACWLPTSHHQRTPAPDQRVDPG